MALDNNSIIIIIIGILNYVLIYRKIKFLGNLIFIALAGFILYYGSTLTNGEATIVNAFGFIALMITIIKTVIDMTKTLQK